MNGTLLLQIALQLAKAEVARHGQTALTTTERMFTIPAKDVAKLTQGMGQADAQEARRLLAVAADAMSDALVFLASRGQVDPD